MARVTVNDITMNAMRLGERTEHGLPPVVFVHGLIMDNLSSYLYTVAPAVADETDVVIYDLRGHGLTDRPSTGYTLDDALDDLEGLLDALEVPRPVVLVGNSVGGTIALHAAITRPGLVAGIGLVEAHPVVEGWGDHLMADIEELVSGFDEPGVREFITGEGGRKLKRMAGVCEDLVTRTSLPADLRAAEPMDAARLGRISCPALLLYGEASDILDRAERLAAEIPGAELRVIEGCTHSVLMEAPDEIGEHLLDWLPTLGVSA